MIKVCFWTMGFTEVDKGRIAALVDEGWNGRRIARRFKWNKNSVQNSTQMSTNVRVNSFQDFIEEARKEKQLLRQIDGLCVPFEDQERTEEFLVINFPRIWRRVEYLSPLELSVDVY